MKNALPLIAMAILLMACDNTKMQLRAPQDPSTEIKTDTANKMISGDTVKIDSAGTILNNQKTLNK